MLAADTVTELLTDATKRKIFQFIAQNRKVRRTEFTRIFGKEDSKSCEKLSELLEANMIGKESAPISDFDSYYITADGLFADRQLRLIKQEVNI